MDFFFFGGGDCLYGCFSAVLKEGKKFGNHEIGVLDRQFIFF